MHRSSVGWATALLACLAGSSMATLPPPPRVACRRPDDICPGPITFWNTHGFVWGGWNTTQFVSDNLGGRVGVTWNWLGSASGHSFGKPAVWSICNDGQAVSQGSTGDFGAYGLGWKSPGNDLYSIRIAFNYPTAWYKWEVTLDFSDYKATRAGGERDGETFGGTMVFIDNLWNGNHHRWTTVSYEGIEADGSVDPQPQWRFYKGGQEWNGRGCGRQDIQFNYPNATVSIIPGKPAVPGTGICGFESTSAMLKMPVDIGYKRVRLTYYTWGISSWEDTPLWIATQDNRNNNACGSLPLCAPVENEFRMVPVAVRSGLVCDASNQLAAATKATSIGDCERRCRTTANCNYINYNPTSRDCSVFNTCRLLDGGDVAAGTIIRKTTRAEDPFFGMTTYEVPKGSRQCEPSKVLLQKAVTDLAACRNLCRDTVNCRYTTFYHTTRSCSAYNVCNPVPGKEDSIIEYTSGSQNPSELDFQMVAVPLGNKDLVCNSKNALAARAQADSLTACERRCADFTGCKYITFSTGQLCGLYGTCDLVPGTAEDAGSVLKKVPNAAEPMFSMVSDAGIDAEARMCDPSRSLISRTVSDTMACRNLCRDTANCRYITFYYKTRVCSVYFTCTVVRPGKDESVIEYVTGLANPEPAKTTGSVSGVLQRPDGSPLAGTVVKLVNTATGNEAGSTTTNEKGEYKFDNIAPGSYVLQPQLPEDVEADAQTVTVVANQNTSAQVVRTKLSTSGRITGKLVDEQGSAVPNMDLAFTQVGKPAVVVRTDASGNYNTRLPAGIWTVVAKPRPNSGFAAVPAVSVRSAAGRNTVFTVRVKKTGPAGSITGTLTDADGNGMSDVTVLIIDPTSGEAVATVTTDENGDYEAVDVPVGNYIVVPVLPPGSNLEADNQTVTVVLGEEVSAGVITPKPATTTTLTVRVVDNNGNPVPNIPATITTSKGQLSATTSTLGIFTVKVPFGAGSVTVRTPAGSNLAAQGPAQFSAVQGRPVSASITLAPAVGSISGRVYHDADTNEAYQAPERVFAGVVVTATTSAGAEVGRATTDANGAYTIPNLARGAYTVAFGAVPGLNLSTRPSKTITVVGGQDSKFDFRIVGTLPSTPAPSDSDSAESAETGSAGSATTTTGVLTGRVFNDRNNNTINDATEPVLPNVKVTVLRLDGSVVGTTTTNAQGTYRVANLAPGQVKVQFGPITGVGQGTGLIRIAGGATSTFDFRIAGIYNPAPIKPGSITGQIFNDKNGDGIPVPDAGISGVKVELRSGAKTVATSTTNAKGAFAFTNVSPGKYNVYAAAPSGYQYVDAEDSSQPDALVAVSVPSGGRRTLSVAFSYTAPEEDFDDGFTDFEQVDDNYY